MKGSLFGKRITFRGYTKLEEKIRLNVICHMQATVTVVGCGNRNGKEGYLMYPACPNMVGGGTRQCNKKLQQDFEGSDTYLCPVCGPVRVRRFQSFFSCPCTRNILGSSMVTYQTAVLFPWHGQRQWPQRPQHHHQQL